LTNGEWEASTDLPENPRFELFFYRYAAPTGQNWTLYPPYSLIEISETFRIYVSDETVVTYLSDEGEIEITHFRWEVENMPGFLWFDPLDGGISLSTDWGNTRIYWKPDPEADLIVPAGQLRVWSQGHAAILALNELLPLEENATLTSPVIGTYDNYPDSWTVNVSNWSRLEPETQLAGSDLSALTPPGSLQYKVDFSSHIVSAGSDDNPAFIRIARIPELKAVDIYQTGTLMAPLDWDDPDNYTLETQIRSIQIDHSAEAGWTAAQTARVEIPWTDRGNFPGNFQFRLGIVQLDDYRETGFSNAFVGIITSFEEVEGRDGKSLVLQLANSLFYRASRIKQEEYWKPLAGMSDTAARNQWLRFIGLPTSRGSWTSRGITLPWGTAREPWGAPAHGVEALELLGRIDAATQCLTYFDVRDGKAYNIFAEDFATIGTTITFYSSRSEAEAAGDRWLVWQDLKVSADQDLITRWKAIGESPAGTFTERLTDWDRERNPNANPFLGFPALNVLEPTFPDRACARLALLAAYDSSSQAWRKVSWISPGIKNAIPPAWAYIQGSDRIGPSDPIRVIGLTHIWEAGQCRTEWQGIAWIN